MSRVRKRPEEELPRKKAFAAEYLANGGKAAAAARAVGLNPARHSALMRDKVVLDLLAAARKRHELRADITVERILNEMAKVGFATIRKFFKLDEAGLPYIDMSDANDDDWAAIEEITTEVYWDGRGDEAREVRKTKFKLHSKLVALERMGKALGMFDGHKGGDPDEQVGPVSYTLKIGNAIINVSSADAGPEATASAVRPALVIPEAT